MLFFFTFISHILVPNFTPEKTVSRSDLSKWLMLEKLLRNNMLEKRTRMRNALCLGQASKKCGTLLDKYEKYQHFKVNVLYVLFYKQKEKSKCTFESTRFLLKHQLKGFIREVSK